MSSPPFRVLPPEPQYWRGVVTIAGIFLLIFGGCLLWRITAPEPSIAQPFRGVTESPSPLPSITPYGTRGPTATATYQIVIVIEATRTVSPTPYPTPTPKETPIYCHDGLTPGQICIRPQLMPSPVTATAIAVCGTYSTVNEPCIWQGEATP